MLLTEYLPIYKPILANPSEDARLTVIHWLAPKGAASQDMAWIMLVLFNYDLSIFLTQIADFLNFHIAYCL